MIRLIMSAMLSSLIALQLSAQKKSTFSFSEQTSDESSITQEADTTEEHIIDYRKLRPGEKGFYDQLQAELNESPESRDEILAQYDLLEPTYTVSDYTVENTGGDMTMANTADSLALVALYDNMDGDFWIDNTNWKVGPLDTWYGITVTAERVTEINLNSNGLYGSIPESIYGLTELRVLDLGNNYLGNQPISTNIGNLLNLEVLQLQNSGIGGSFPRELTNCSNLQYLNLEGYNASGDSLPSALLELPLIELNLNYTYLGGAFPTTNITTLEVLGLNNCYFDGSFPANLAGNVNMRELYLGYNQWLYDFSAVPAEIDNFDNLEILDISDNYLFEIPSFVFAPTTLLELRAQYNVLTGTESAFFTNVASTNLQFIDISYCDMYGVVPESINSLTTLTTFYAYGNYFDGLPDLTSTSTYFDFSYNKLTFEDLEFQSIDPGNLYVSGQRSTTEYQDINIYEGSSIVLDATVGGTGNFYQWYYNGATDATTATITASQPGDYYCDILNDAIGSTYNLSLSTGTFYINIIPVADVDDSLALVSLYNNTGMANTGYSSSWLQGPVAFWDGINLDQDGYVRSLSLSDIPINGPVPTDVFSLDSLVSLEYYYSGITSIPAAIGGLTNLQDFNFNGNSISVLPAEIANLTDLQYLNISNNNFTTFPTELLGLSSLSQIQMEYNQLTTFPINVGEITALQYLYLRGNLIDTLPDMNALDGISSIDLTDNHLDFADLEPYYTLGNFQYNYQKSLPNTGDFQIVSAGTEVTLSLNVGGTANIYQWLANGDPIPGATSPTLTYTVTETVDLRLAVQSELVTNLTLSSEGYQYYIPTPFSIPGPGFLYMVESEYYDSLNQYYDETLGISFTNFDFSNLQTLVENIGIEWIDIDEDNQRIYFTGELYGDTEAILYIDLTSGNIVIVYEGAFEDLEGIALDPSNEHIYYTQGYGPSFIKRVNYDGTGEITLVSGLSDASEIDLDLVNGKVYWVNNETNASLLQRADLNGANAETLLSIPDFDGYLTVDDINSSIYWVERTGSGDIREEFAQEIGISSPPKLVRANLDGTDSISYTTLQDFSYAYTIDKSTQTLYYNSYDENSEIYQSSIRKSNLDGSSDVLFGDFPVNSYVYWMLPYRGEGPDLSTITSADSLALVNIFRNLGGTSWINKSGWMTGPANTWHGVTINSNTKRVTGLALPNNNLTGKLDQNLFTNLTALQAINLQGNNLTGGIPGAFFALSNLQIIKLGHNKLAAAFPTPAEGYVAPWVVFEINHNGFYGKLPSTGSYPVLERLRLDSNRFEGRLILPLSNMSGLKQLAINDNLLSGELPDVSALTSIDSLNASGNAFTGSIPASVGSLETLTYLNLSNNQLTGSAGSINTFGFIDLSHNKLTDVSGVNLSAQVDVRNNWLDFGDFSALSSSESAQYYPQKNLFGRVDSLHTANQELIISFPVDETVGNIYQWRKALLSVTGQYTFNNLTDSVSSSLNFDNPDGQNEGAYQLVITNPAYSEMTLQTSPFILKITSLERDKAALLALLDSTEGFTPNNWAAANDITAGNWEGVTLNQANTRVTSLILPGTADRHWTGVVPESFADLTGLLTLDLSGHEFRSFPDITTMRGLTAANIAGNRLSFAHLIPNKPLINKITYSPQRRYGETEYDTLDAGANYLLEVDNMGEGSQYYWVFGPYKPGQRFNNDSSALKGNERLLAIDNLDYDQQGTYRAYVRHPDFPKLTIQSRNKNIMAKTDLEGTINKNGQPLTTGAEIFIWRKTPQGPFVKEDSAGVNTSDGTYSFTDVVLGDFVVQVKPNRQADTTTIQTYFIAAENYRDANILALRTDTSAIDIDILFYSPASRPATGAKISGTIESDFDETEVDEEGNRIQARRKVRKAACSMRRFKSQGRPGQDAETEIAYYIETDDEGYFNFDGVEPGTYLINIEFPGVPMDPSSEVEFEISEDKENQVFDVDALITETGIEIIQTEVLFNWKPYVKEVNLYPNPTAGVLGIDYMVYRNIDDLKIEVLNVQGSKVLKSKVNHTKGMHSTTLDMSNFESGMYFVIFTDEKATFRHEFKVTRK